MLWNEEHALPTPLFVWLVVAIGSAAFWRVVYLAI
jgi:hypothetical protein